MIYLDKYKTAGQIFDYGVLIKLKFSYEGREYTIGLRRPIDTELIDFGYQVLETAIEKLTSNPEKTALHYWYVDDRNIAHGVVTGHNRLPDALKIHTSQIIETAIDQETNEAVIITNNTVYRCPLNYCRFEKQDMFSNALPDYERLKEQYKGTVIYPETEQGNVLLVLADFAEYYFHSLCVKDKNGKRVKYRGCPHIGMSQDSYLIEAECNEFYVDLRYFPHYRNIELYCFETDGMPLYVENVGESTLYIKFRGMQFSVASGERKALSEENAENSTLYLPDGDLYPAVIF